MPTRSTLTSPLGIPVDFPDQEDRDVFANTSRASRIVPLVVGGIGAAIILGGSILYAAGVIGAPVLNPTEEVPSKEPSWEPNPEFSKALGVQALKKLEEYERRGKMSRPPGGTEDIPKAADPQRAPPSGYAEPPR